MSKKELVSKIKYLLSNLHIGKYGCVDIHSLPDVSWVSYTQVSKLELIKSVTYRHYRVGLYSKEVSLEELVKICEELEDKVKIMKYENDTK